MVKSKQLILLLGLALVLAACTSPEPTLTPTPTVVAMGTATHLPTTTPTPLTGLEATFAANKTQNAAHETTIAAKHTLTASAPTQTPTPNYTPTPTPTLSFPEILEGTLIPQPEVPISPGNVYQVSQLARLGKGKVERTIYSPSGRYMAVGTSAGVYIYDMRTLTELQVIQTDMLVKQVVFSPDERLLAGVTGGNFSRVGNTIQVWQVSDGVIVNKTEGYNVAFTRAGTLLAMRAHDDGIQIWNATDDVLISTLADALTYGLKRAAFSADGALVAMEHYLGSVGIWRVSDGALLHVLKSDDINQLCYGGITSIDISRDGSRLVAGCIEFGKIYIWQIGDGTLLRVIDAESWQVQAVTFSSDGSLIAGNAAWNSGEVKLWRVSDGALLRSLGYSWGDVTSISFSPNGLRVVIGWRNGKVTVVRTQDGVLERTLHEYTPQGHGLDFSPEGEFIAAGAWRGVQLWSMVDGKLLEKTMRSLSNPAPSDTIFLSPPQLSGPTGILEDAVLSPDGQYAAVAYDCCDIEVWQIYDETRLYSTVDRSIDLLRLAFVPNSKTLAVISEEDIKLYDVDTGGLTETIAASGGGSITAAVFSPVGQILAVSKGSISVTLIDYGNADVARRSFGKGLVHDLAFSPDGSLLAMVKGDRLQFWRVEDGYLLHEVMVSAENLYSPVFSPDGQVLAAGTRDGQVCFWQAVDGKLLYCLRGHLDRVTELAFSPDGRFLATGAYDGTVRLWGVLP